MKSTLSPSAPLNPAKPFGKLPIAFAMVILATTIANAQTFSVLYNFGTHTGDPFSPVYTGLLAQGRDGNLYSTSPNGGNLCSCCGAMFKITPSGTLTNLFNFNFASNAPTAPFGGLTLGTDGEFYGTTNSCGTLNEGTVFKITSSGSLTPLHNLGGCKNPCVEGTFPTAPPVEGRDGNFYGTTPSSSNGTNTGIVYKITPAGTYTTLHRFTTGFRLQSARSPHFRRRWQLLWNDHPRWQDRVKQLRLCYQYLRYGLQNDALR